MLRRLKMRPSDAYERSSTLRGSGLVRTLKSSACASSPSGSRVSRSPVCTSTSMISASGTSKAGPGSRRDHTSSSRFSAGVAKRAFAEPYSLSVPVTTRPLMTWQTGTAVELMTAAFMR